MNNIEIFEDTRHLSLTKYADKTAKLIENTKVYKDATKIEVASVNKQVVEFVPEFTVTAGIKGCNLGYQVALLNFADALEAGGLVLLGASTQEESLCRASNLYESLLKRECEQDYYRYNQKLNLDEFSSRLIYSKGVTVFKNEYSVELTEPVKLDIITIPFPLGNVGNMGIYRERIECILNIANSYEINYLVLGAIGTGAFGNPVEEVAQAFAEVLSQRNYVENIVFAIRGTSEDDETYDIFKESFDKHYRKR